MNRIQFGTHIMVKAAQGDKVMDVRWGSFRPEYPMACGVAKYAVERLQARQVIDRNAHRILPQVLDAEPGVEAYQVLTPVSSHSPKEKQHAEVAALEAVVREFEGLDDKSSLSFEQPKQAVGELRGIVEGQINKPYPERVELDFQA